MPTTKDAAPEIAGGDSAGCSNASTGPLYYGLRHHILRSVILNHAGYASPKTAAEAYSPDSSANTSPNPVAYVPDTLGSLLTLPQHPAPTPLTLPPTPPHTAAHVFPDSDVYASPDATANTFPDTSSGSATYASPTLRRLRHPHAAFY